MNLEFLFEVAREYGREPESWPLDVMHNVVFDLYAAESSWLDDALAELDRKELLAHLRQHSVRALGTYVQSSLIDYPLDWFASQIADHYDDWLSHREREERYTALAS